MQKFDPELIKVMLQEQGIETASSEVDFVGDMSVDYIQDTQTARLPSASKGYITKE